MTLYTNSSDTQMQRIISKCPSLHETYKPPWWCIGGWMNVFVTLFKEQMSSTLPMRRDTIITDDGGEISIDWANDDVTQKLPDDAPIIGILHPLTGDSWNQSGFMSYAASRGWRSCVLNRRGHSGMPLRVIPNFNIIGHIDDSVVMVNYIRDIYKNNFIALAGISAGSGQLVSYIGREGANAKINAAASLCPAWDLSESFSRLQKSNPYLDWFITRGVQNYFLRPSRNQTALSTMKDVVNKAWKATSIVDFMNAAAPLAGSNDLENYFKVNNPMNYILGNAVPCLVLNALDDFLCVKENIQVDLKDKVNNFVLLVTDEGGHIAYNESIHAGNYMWRVTLDFFEAVKLEYHK